MLHSQDVHGLLLLLLLLPSSLPSPTLTTPGMGTVSQGAAGDW
jgi:hypothetical protein